MLDRRRTYRQLALIGVPMAVLDRARSLETQVPLVLLAVGSTVTGIVAAAPLTRLGLSGSGVDLPGFVVLVGCTGLGLLGVRVACAASRPLLARVAADPASTSDRPLPPGEVAVPGPADRRLRSGPRFPGR